MRSCNCRTDFIRDEIDKKSNGIACFIDLQKIFDSLNHNILLAKLNNYGFRCPIYIIIVDYLSSRSQYVFVNGKWSDISKIATGVTKGSALGPFFFLVYINDFPQAFQNDNKLVLFADDTSITKTGKGNCNMQSGLDKFVIGSIITNCLSTPQNMRLSFGSNYQNTFTVHNEVISRNTCCKYLGVYIVSKLTLRDHTNHVVKNSTSFVA